MFDPEKCPDCGETTEVEHYDTGWRCICACGWYGVFHFDERMEASPPCGKTAGCPKPDENEMY